MSNKPSRVGGARGETSPRAKVSSSDAQWKEASIPHRAAHPPGREGEGEGGPATKAHTFLKIVKTDRTGSPTGIKSPSPWINAFNRLDFRNIFQLRFLYNSTPLLSMCALDKTLGDFSSRNGNRARGFYGSAAGWDTFSALSTPKNAF